MKKIPRMRKKLDALADALNALPEAMQGAVVLRYHDGLSVSETARVMEIELNEVETLTREALAFLGARGVI